MIYGNNVSKEIAGQKAIRDMTFHIKENTISGLIGRNGAGKSTLLKLITGCWYPTQGEIKVLNERPFDSLFVSANSILIDDEMTFPEVLSLGELLEVTEQFYPNWDRGLAERLFSYFELQKGVFYYQLSKGKKSIFNAIIGLCSRVPLTVFDEPTNGMDRSVRQDFYKVLLKDYIAHPRTIVISSHHIEEIESILEDLILIEAGEMLLHLPIDEVREYARGIRGPEAEVRSWLQDKTVLYEERVARGELFAVVKNDDKIMSAEQGSFTVSAIAAADLAVYLTRKGKGGIDRVFSTKS